MNLQQDIYTRNWETACHKALDDGLQIIEHGWEQHVIVDEAKGIIYRYPKHSAGAAKLSDEVSVLKDIHKYSWQIELPVLLEHTDFI